MTELLDAVAAVLHPKRIGGRPATPEDLARLSKYAFGAALQGQFPASGDEGAADDEAQSAPTSCNAPAWQHGDEGRHLGGRS